MSGDTRAAWSTSCGTWDRRASRASSALTSSRSSVGNARKLRTLADLDVHERRVLLRVDFNVPFDDGRIIDDSRIRATLPTIRALLSEGAEVLLVTHRGRPGGRVVPGLSVPRAAPGLERFLGMRVRGA